AARMRRNGANLMVLAGAQISREQAESVPVTALVNAAASEVEDYPRIVTEGLPDSEIDGVVAGDLVHLLAELLDNALRYSPPTTQVRVSAVHTGNNGLVIEVSDTGLGMTESDLRVANTRLDSGGEVNPYTARHMGLFVVGRLAAAHGLVVRLRSTIAGRADSGTTAGVYIPARLLVRPRPALHSEPVEQRPARPEPTTPEPARTNGVGVVAAAEVSAGPAVELLPRRRPGASGIADTPATPFEPVPMISQPPAPQPPAPQPPTRPDVAAFFAERPPVTANAHVDDDAIYKKMLSEWLVDPHELSHSTDLNWKSVWDNGWSAAQAAESVPVRDHTSEGLPVRQPGARLVPGAADDVQRPTAEPVRDPEAVRASIGGHFGGVHAGRRHAKETGGTHRE
ncbi:histidine kinase, partial [Mycobacterium sp. ITM-2017-0098]